MNILLINDLHLGVKRSGGTTPKSSAALNEYAHRQHEKLLEMADAHTHVVVNGDLTDEFDLPLVDALCIYKTACNFLNESRNRKLTWLLGNHDLSKDSNKLGTVAFVGALLSGGYPDRFQILDQPDWVEPGVYGIPHLVNQAIFDLALSAVPDCKYLLLHCNYDNPFAGQQDHSLNLARAQAKEFKDRGITCVLGHEHQHRTAFGGGVLIVGNQFPTSVADCLSHGDGQLNGEKYALRLLADNVDLVTTWAVDGRRGAGFCEVDWRGQETPPEDVKFIRVKGTALAEEAADVARAISRLRQTHNAFVITNAVQVERIDGVEFAQESLEDVQNIDVIKLLIEHLTPEQASVVRTTLEEVND